MYVFALLPIIVYLGIKNNKSPVTMNLRKYRSIVVIISGISILYLFNLNHFEIVNIVIPTILIVIGCYYLIHDYIAHHAQKK